MLIFAVLYSNYCIPVIKVSCIIIVGTLIGHKGSVKMCCFSPDGTLIGSTGGGGDETLKIWDVNAMKCINTFEKHECR